MAPAGLRVGEAVCTEEHCDGAATPPRIKVHAAELKGHTEGHLLFCRILLELGNWEIMDLGSKHRVRQGWQQPWYLLRCSRLPLHTRWSPTSGELGLKAFPHLLECPRRGLTCSLGYQCSALAGVAQRIACRPANQRVAGLIPTRHMPGLWARSPVGNHTPMFLSLTFSLPSPLSKINKLKSLKAGEKDMSI